MSELQKPNNILQLQTLSQSAHIKNNFLNLFLIYHHQKPVLYVIIAIN